MPDPKPHDPVPIQSADENLHEEVPWAYTVPVEDVTGSSVNHDDKYIALYAGHAGGDEGGPMELTWHISGDTYGTWQAAFGSLLATGGIKAVRIVKINVPCYILPKSQIS